MIGPYKVKKLVEFLYRLDLPTSMKIHDVFYPNLFQSAANNPLSGQQNSPLLPIVVNNKKK